MNLASRGKGDGNMLLQACNNPTEKSVTIYNYVILFLQTVLQRTATYLATPATLMVRPDVSRMICGRSRSFLKHPVYGTILYFRILRHKVVRSMPRACAAFWRCHRCSLRASTRRWRSLSLRSSGNGAVTALSLRSPRVA